MQCVQNCAAADPNTRRNFEQPVWQTAQMFVGEMGCWLVVAVSALYRRLLSPASTGYSRVSVHEANESDDDSANPAAKPLLVNDPDREPLTGWRLVLLAIPAVCDIAGTTLMNIGLLFVAASIYQMTRGMLVLFVALFSVIFLRRRLAGFKWVALLVVVGGVAIVGLAGAVEQKHARLPGTDPDATRPDVSAASPQRELLLTLSTPTPPLQTVIGILLIALAQVFTASQFVVEESIMERYSLSPLTVVGWEGTFGLVFTLLGMLVAHFVYGRTPAGRGGYFDAVTGWQQLTAHRAIAVSSVLIMVSIGGFNFFGLSVTRSVSATSRSTIDTCRTLFIWVISLGLGWESFKWLQVLGFAALVYGTFLFNDIVRPPRWWGRTRGDAELLPERPVEHH